MIRLNNRHWITLDGAPVTGRTPPRVCVYGPKMTGAQEAQVRQIYKLFTDVCLVAVGDYQVRRRILGDGTRVRCTSFMGQDFVEVWTDGRDYEPEAFGGYAFRCMSDTTPAEQPSRLLTQARYDPPRRKYEFIPQDNENYGLGRWHGRPVKNINDHPLALSWDAGTAQWKITPEAGGLASYYTEKFTLSEGYANVNGVGTGSKVYFKSLVAVNLADPELIRDTTIPGQPVMGSAIGTMNIQGAAMSEKHINIVLSSGIAPGVNAFNRPIYLGQSNGRAVYSTPVMNYKLYFIRLKYNLSASPSGVTLTVEKKYEVLYKIDGMWIESRKLDWQALAESAAPEGFLHYRYAEFRTLPQSLLIPISLWHFDETGTRAHALFTEGDITSRAKVVLEFKASDEAEHGATVDPFMARLTLNMDLDGGGFEDLVPGGYNAPYSSGGESLSISTDEIEVTGVSLQKFPSSLLAPHDYGGERWGSPIAVGFDGQVPVRAEIATTHVEAEYSETASCGKPYDESSTQATIINNRIRQESLLFFKGDAEVARMLWGERNNTLNVQSEATNATVEGVWITRQPSKVLYVDPVSKSAEWVEVKNTRDVSGAYPGITFSVGAGPSDSWLDIYKLRFSPRIALLEVSLRSMTNGRLNTEVPLGARALSGSTFSFTWQTVPLHSWGSYTPTPFSSSVPASEQPFDSGVVNPEFQALHNNEVIFISVWDFMDTLPFTSAGSQASSWASYYDDFFASTNTDLIGNASAYVFRTTGPLLETITTTETAIFNRLKGGQAEVVTQQQEMLRAWFSGITLY